MRGENFNLVTIEKKESISPESLLVEEQLKGESLCMEARLTLKHSE